MYHVSAQGVDDYMIINVHYYYYYYSGLALFGLFGFSCLFRLYSGEATMQILWATRNL